MNKAKKKYTVKPMWAVLLCLATLLGACKHDNLTVPKPNENIRPAADFIKNNYDFRLLYAALEYTGLINELNGPGPFTILAPNDDAFKQEGINTVNDIKKLNRDSLRQVLQYHVLKNRRLLTSDIPTDAVDVRYETLSGDRVYVSGVNRMVRWYFSGSMLTRTNINVANGVMHVVAKMMKLHKGVTVQQHLSKYPRYSIFVAALKKFNLWDRLAATGAHTVFAPTNSAFAAKGVTAADIEAMNPAAYHTERFLGCYMLNGRHFFVSDWYVFSYIGTESNYERILGNNGWVLRLTSTSFYDSPIQWVPYLSLNLLGPGPYGQEYKARVEPNTGGKYDPVAAYDHLCDNGLVHDIQGILLSPSEAVK